MAVSTIKESSNRTMTGTASKTVSVHNTTTITTISLPEGTWLIDSYMRLGTGGSSAYNHILGSLIVRSTEVNGGGSHNVRLVTGPSNQDVKCYHNVTNGCTVDVTWFAVKLL